MVLRIPPDAQPSVQQAFRELDESIAKLATQGGIGLDESTIRALIREEIAASIRSRSYPPTEDIMRGTGPSHMHGDVPDPGGAVGTSSVSTSDQVLHEDGQWKWPLSGNLVDVSDPTDPVKRYNLHAGLITDGPIVAGGPLFCGEFINNGMDSVRLSNSGNVAITSGAAPAFSWDTVDFNYGVSPAFLTSAPTIISFANPGLVIVGASLRWAASATAGIRGVDIRQDGTSIGCTQFNSADGAQVMRATTVSLAVVKAGTQFKVHAFQTTGSDLNVTAASFFWAAQLARMA